MHERVSTEVETLTTRLQLYESGKAEALQRLHNELDLTREELETGNRQSFLQVNNKCEVILLFLVTLFLTC